jgi:hypothetical protein
VGARARQEGAREVVGGRSASCGQESKPEVEPTIGARLPPAPRSYMMQRNTIINRLEKHKSFVYGTVNLDESGEEP